MPLPSLLKGLWGSRGSPGEDADLPPIAERAAEALLGAPSSGHQDREVGLVQDRACDTTEYQLVEAGVAVGAHDEEIGTERGGVRQQNAAHVLAAGRQASHLHVRVVTRQVSSDVRSRLLAVTRP